MMPDVPPEVTYILKKIMDILGMDWGAADFKESYQNGNYYFLEVDANPMFSVFDKVAKGFIGEEIVNFLEKKYPDNKQMAFTH